MRLRDALNELPDEDESAGDDGAAKSGRASKGAMRRLLEARLSEGWGFRYNELSQLYEMRAHDDATGNAEEWREIDWQRDVGNIVRQLEFENFNVSRARIIDILETGFVPEYNPILDYLNDVAHKHKDAHGYIDKLLDTVELLDGAALSEWRALGRQWIYSAAACALGMAVNDVMLVLVSDVQGIGKTRWLNRLCPPALEEYRKTTRLELDLGKAETCQLITENFIVNIDDQLKSMFNKDFEALKSVVSNDKVNFRKPYARAGKTKRRVCSFVASLNGTDVFYDEYNRRYLTFAVKALNHTHRIDMDKVYAEAVNDLRRGASAYFQKDQLDRISQMAEAFRSRTAEEEALLRNFVPATKDDLYAIDMTATEILSQLQNITGIRNLNGKRLGGAMKRHGFKLESLYKTDLGYSQKVYYVRRIERNAA